MSPLTVIAKPKAKSGSEERLFEELRDLVAPTRAREGCMNYDLHRSWESRPLRDQHMESPRLKEFSGKQDELTEVWELFVGEKV